MMGPHAVNRPSDTGDRFPTRLRLARQAGLVTASTYVAITIMCCAIVLFVASFSGCGAGTEADREATRYWDSVLTKCAGSTYFVDFNWDLLFELRGAKIATSRESPSKADRLNGVEWYAVSQLHADTIRNYDQGSGGWSAWRDVREFELFRYCIKLTKWKGNVQRTFCQSLGFPTESRMKKISCTEVPR